MPGWQHDSPPPSVLVGQRAADRSLPSSTNAPALALAAEAERLEREQHHRRERVVDLAHVDVGRREPGPLEGELRRCGRPGDSVKSSHSLIVVCDVASPVPSTHTGAFAQSRARSSVVSTTAPPPSERMQQCSFVNGSAIIGDDCTSSIVIGSR